MKKIIFGGGCFWGVQKYFDNIQGVINTKVGYANCITDNPNYEDVCREKTGCVEAVEVEYDEKEISDIDLVKYFYSIINPTTRDRQGPDIGTQYRPGIYYVEEIKEYQEYVQTIQPNFDNKIVVEYCELTNFYEAEKYHQKYLDNNQNGYCHINIYLMNNPQKYC